MKITNFLSREKLLTINVRTTVLVTSTRLLTVCTSDLDELNMIRWFNFRLENIFATVPAALKRLIV